MGGATRGKNVAVGVVLEEPARVEVTKQGVARRHDATPRVAKVWRVATLQGEACHGESRGRDVLFLLFGVVLIGGARRERTALLVLLAEREDHVAELRKVRGKLLQPAAHRLIGAIQHTAHLRKRQWATASVVPLGEEEVGEDAFVV